MGKFWFHLLVRCFDMLNNVQTQEEGQVRLIFSCQMIIFTYTFGPTAPSWISYFSKITIFPRKICVS